MRTSGTVTTCAAKTSSWISPRLSISASACRINSPTRSWRCEGPVLFSVRCLGMTNTTKGRNPRGSDPNSDDAKSERPRNRLHVEALDDVALADVLVIGERHAALL